MDVVIAVIILLNNNTNVCFYFMQFFKYKNEKVEYTTYS